VPTKTLTLKGDSLRSTVQINATSDKGTLVHAAIFNDEEIENTAKTWAQIYILRGGTATEHRAVALTAGYVNSISSPSWTGRIRLEPDDRVQLRVQSSGSDTIRAVFNIEQDR